jgi:hypothetical protein
VLLVVIRRSIAPAARGGNEAGRGAGQEGRRCDRAPLRANLGHTVIRNVERVVPAAEGRGKVGGRAHKLRRERAGRRALRLLATYAQKSQFI